MLCAEKAAVMVDVPGEEKHWGAAQSSRGDEHLR